MKQQLSCAKATDVVHFLHPGTKHAATPKNPEELDALKDALRTAIAAHHAPSSDGVRWSEVLKIALQLLASEVDLKVAAYAIAAKGHLEGIGGCIEGLGALGHLLRHHWPHLKPAVARLRGREIALMWLHEEMALVLQGLAPVSTAEHQALMTAAENVDESVDTYFGNAAPHFLPQARALAVTMPAPPQLEAAATKRESMQPPEFPPSLPRATELNAWGEHMVRTADAHLSQNPYATQALRLRRLGLWLHIDAINVDKGGRSLVVCLPHDLRTKLQNLAHEGLWQHLFVASEAAMARNRLHLDLQYFSAEACLHLPEAGRAQHNALRQETQALLARLPELREAQATDGSFLLGEATRAWLAIPAHASLQTQPASGAGKVLTSHAEPSPGAQRTHFLQRLGDTESMTKKVTPSLAASAWRALSAIVYDQQLHTWEPQLALRVYGQEAQVLQHLERTPRCHARLQQIMNRIAAIDVAYAKQLSESIQQAGAQHE